MASSVLAVITKPEAIRKILDHLGIPSEAPRRTAASPPPQAKLERARSRFGTGREASDLCHAHPHFSFLKHERILSNSGYRPFDLK
jgi:hypothetical protein